MSAEKTRQAICARVSQTFREERVKQGLSMTVLAERAGLSQQMVSYVERGMRNPTLETLLRMADALEVELVDVLNRATEGVARHKSK